MTGKGDRHRVLSVATFDCLAHIALTEQSSYRSRCATRFIGPPDGRTHRHSGKSSVEHLLKVPFVDAAYRICWQARVQWCEGLDHTPQKSGPREGVEGFGVGGERGSAADVVRTEPQGRVDLFESVGRQTEDLF